MLLDDASHSELDEAAVSVSSPSVNRMRLSQQLREEEEEFQPLGKLAKERPSEQSAASSAPSRTSNHQPQPSTAGSASQHTATPPAAAAQPPRASTGRGAPTHAPPPPKAPPGWTGPDLHTILTKVCPPRPITRPPDRHRSKRQRSTWASGTWSTWKWRAFTTTIS